MTDLIERLRKDVNDAEYWGWLSNKPSLDEAKKLVATFDTLRARVAELEARIAEAEKQEPVLCVPASIANDCAHIAARGQFLAAIEVARRYAQPFYTRPLHAHVAAVPDARLGNRLHVWDYDNPEDGSWDNIEEYLHDTTPNAGETVRLNLALPLQDVEVVMLEVGECGEPIRWEVRDVKTGAMLAAKAKGE